MYTLLTEQELAKQLSVSLASVRRWRINGRGPLFVKVGVSVRYRPEDIEAWLGELPTTDLIRFALQMPSRASWSKLAKALTEAKIEMRILNVKAGQFIRLQFSDRRCNGF
jgi:predicted DNA-binding transcriptional regulator AlpA